MTEPENQMPEGVRILTEMHQRVLDQNAMLKDALRRIGDASPRGARNIALAALDRGRIIHTCGDPRCTDPEHMRVEP